MKPCFVVHLILLSLSTRRVFCEDVIGETLAQEAERVAKPQDKACNHGTCTVLDNKGQCTTCRCKIGYRGRFCAEALTKIDGRIVFDVKDKPRPINRDRMAEIFQLAVPRSREVVVKLPKKRRRAIVIDFILYIERPATWKNHLDANIVVTHAQEYFSKSTTVENIFGTGADADIGFGRVTINVDECKSEWFDCHKDAVCEDKRPGYNCVCDTGFKGNGLECEEIFCTIGSSPITPFLADRSIAFANGTILAFPPPVVPFGTILKYECISKFVIVEVDTGNTAEVYTISCQLGGWKGVKHIICSMELGFKVAFGITITSCIIILTIGGAFVTAFLLHVKRRKKSLRKRATRRATMLEEAGFTELSEQLKARAIKQPVHKQAFEHFQRLRPGASRLQHPHLDQPGLGQQLVLKFDEDNNMTLELAPLPTTAEAQKPIAPLGLLGVPPEAKKHHLAVQQPAPDQPRKPKSPPTSPTTSPPEAKKLLKQDVSPTPSETHKQPKHVPSTSKPPGSKKKYEVAPPPSEKQKPKQSPPPTPEKSAEIKKVFDLPFRAKRYSSEPEAIESQRPKTVATPSKTKAISESHIGKEVSSTKPPKGVMWHEDVMEKRRASLKPQTTDQIDEDLAGPGAEFNKSKRRFSMKERFDARKSKMLTGLKKMTSHPADTEASEEIPEDGEEQEERKPKRRSSLRERLDSKSQKMISAMSTMITKNIVADTMKKMASSKNKTLEDASGTETNKNENAAAFPSTSYEVPNVSVPPSVGVPYSTSSEKSNRTSPPRRPQNVSVPPSVGVPHSTSSEKSNRTSPPSGSPQSSNSSVRSAAKKQLHPQISETPIEEERTSSIITGVLDTAITRMEQHPADSADDALESAKSDRASNENFEVFTSSEQVVHHSSATEQEKKTKHTSKHDQKSTDF